MISPLCDHTPSYPRNFMTRSKAMMEFNIPATKVTSSLFFIVNIDKK